MTVRLSEFACGLGRSAGAPFLMLWAYFDESGHEANKDILAMAGLLGTAEEWSLFEPDWASALADYELPYFHASKMNRKFGPLCKGWPAKCMNEYMGRAVSAIADRDFLSLSCGIRISDYQAVFGGSQWLSARMGGPYKLLYEFCVQTVYKWMERNPAVTDEKVSIVFASNEEFGGAARLAGEGYVEHEVWGGRIHSVTSGSYKETLPLQAADFVAYEAYKRFSKELLGDGPEMPRVSYRRLAQEVAMAPESYFDAEGVFNVAGHIALRDGNREAMEYLTALAKRMFPGLRDEPE